MSTKDKNVFSLTKADALLDDLKKVANKHHFEIGHYEAIGTGYPGTDSKSNEGITVDLFWYPPNKAS